MSAVKAVGFVKFRMYTLVRDRMYHRSALKFLAPRGVIIRYMKNSAYVEIDRVSGNFPK